MKTLFVLIITSLMLISVGCTKDQSTEPAMSGGEFYSDENIAGQISVLPKTEITPEISEGLLYMREEEKVARDIYIALGNKWNLKVFKNIATSEQRHMDAIKVLIDRYELKDPVGENKEGVFSDIELQKLYNDLLAEGMKSSKDALLVGKLIEEVDIKDLDIHLKNVTNESDISFVYQNLKKGSVNHLNAFLQNLRRMP